MAVFSEERAYLSAAADELEDYLLSRAADWRLSGPESLPPLTPGGVLLTMKRLGGLNSADGEVEQIQEALDKIEIVRIRWKTAWMRRIEQEVPQRIRLMANYLDELIQSRNLAHPEFHWNIRWRVIIALLVQEIETLGPGTSQQLIDMDEKLLSISRPGPFVWERNLEKTFDPANFWFLYLQVSPSI